VLWVLELQTVWNVVQWGSLKPDEISITSGSKSPEIPKRGKRTLHRMDADLYSVPTEYLSVDTCGPCPYASECLGADASIGTVRIRKWNSDCRRFVSWTYVPLLHSIAGEKL
jgi:hypothetical protein